MVISSSVLNKKYTDDINFIIQEALGSVNPFNCVNDSIDINNENLTICDSQVNLKDINKTYVIGAGKAVIPMTEGVLQKIRPIISSGFIITKKRIPFKQKDFSEKVRILQGGHPIPTQDSIDSTLELVNFLDRIEKSDLVINLISGGGSALMALPCKGISLRDYIEMTSVLLGCGATIQEINTIRKHTDQIKGGGLARFIYPAKLITLILSDVPGDEVSMIASGPTSPDETTYKDAINIINNYQIESDFPKRIVDHLNMGAKGGIEETVKRENKIFQNVTNKIIGSLNTAIISAEKAANIRGYKTSVYSTNLIGESKEVGKILGVMLKNMVQKEPISKPACVIAGGETTVTIKGSGKGGRNQELALSAATIIDGLENCCLVSFSTDGEDGPTDAAGAFVTGETIKRGKRMDLNYLKFLDNNDSYKFLNRTQNLIKTGSTGTNVNDIQIMFAF